MSSAFLGSETFGLMSGDGTATTRESDNNRGGSAKTSTTKNTNFLASLKIGISRRKLAHFLGDSLYKLAHFLGESFHKLAHFLVKRLHSWYTIVNRKEMIV